MPKINRSLKRQTRQLSLSNFETRDNGDGTLTFRGYASTFSQPYEMGFFQEQVSPGAFTKTLSESPDVRFLINHAGLPLARTKSGTLQLSQDSTGLAVEADLDAADPDVQSLLPKMARGDVDQMSFGFRIIREQWSPDYSQCDLTELALDGGDVSIVTFPANPNTSATLRSLRNHMTTFSPEAIRDFYKELATFEERSGAVFSAANKAVLTALLSDLTDIGSAISEIAADVADSSDRLDTLMANSGAEPETTTDEQTDSAVTTDDERTAGIPLALALAQAEAIRLRA